MLKNQTNITDFMAIADQAVLQTPSFIEDKNVKLRSFLILEELVEYADANGFDFWVNGVKIDKKLVNVDFIRNSNQPSLKEVGDSIGDLDYVVTGTACAHGFDLEKLHDEVHGSNMTKLWTWDEISNTDLPVNVTLKRIYSIDAEKCWVVRNEHGKMLKSPSYVPANFEPIESFSI